MIVDMKVATLDILIEKGRFSPESARAIGEAIDLEVSRSRDSLATKRDLDDGLEGVRAGFVGVDARFQKIEARFQNFERRFEKFESRFENLEGRFESFQPKMTALFESFKSEMARWMFAALAAQMVAITAIVHFLLQAALRR